MKLIETYIVSALKQPCRLSDVPAGSFHTLHSRKAFKKAIKDGLVKRNNSLAYTGDFISENDVISIYKDESVSKKPTIHLPVEILFEDDYLAIINKPAGIEVSGNKKYTLENALPLALKKSTQPDALERPLPAHRLDYPTSGCLLIGKTSETLRALHLLFKEKEIVKKYLAVTIGDQISEGKINEPVDTKPSYSSFKVLKTIASKKYGALNLVELIPHTGRRHQLRKHLTFIGNPILGDKIYFIEGKISKGNGLYLHAIGVRFKHPYHKKVVQYYGKPPKKFSQLFTLQSIENLVFTNLL